MMAARKNKNIQVPEPTLRRLPGYLFYLEKEKEKGVLTISAPTIGRDLKCDPTQVVKDIAVTGVKGKPKVGYNIYELIHSLEEFLGFNRTNEAFLVGAGNLGTGLMAYQENQSLGIKIIAAFDTDESKIGKQVGGVHILNYQKLFHLSDRLNVKIGIVTTPNSAAQEVAEDLINCGIKAIWNFTATNLNLPENVVIQNTSMRAYAAVLLQQLNNLDE